MKKITEAYLISKYKLTYGSYKSMIYRCLIDKNDNTYYNKITICKRWMEPNHKGFLNFLSDMGERPSGQHTIDRKRGRLSPYKPSNCQWATKKEQAANRSSSVLLTCEDVTMCASDWAKIIGISRSRMSQYKNLGMGMEEICSFKRYKKWKDIMFEYDGKSLNINEWSKLTGISAQILKCRIFQCQWTFEKAITTPVKPKKKKAII